MEQRRHRRIPFQREISLSDRHNQETRLEASDFSLSGIGLRSAQPATVGERVRLRFKITTLGQVRELDLAGEIRRVKPLSQGYAIGVSFVD